MKSHWFLGLLCWTIVTPLGAAESLIPLRDGDRVILLGSTFLERAQRYGFLEAELTRLNPDRQIRFRSLAWSGDTVFGDSWFYSKSHADHTVRRDQLYAVVQQQKPSVIVVGYGAVEAFEGEAGLGRWRQGLQVMLDRLGETGARLVLLTSPPQQLSKSSSASRYNRQLRDYMAAMQEIAEQRDLPLVDLGRRMDDYYREHPDAPITENGLHLNEAGYRVVARLFGEAMGYQTRPWRVAVDAVELRLQGESTTGEVIRDEDRLTFRVQDEMLPQPISECPTVGDGEQRVLRISGLNDGSYTLYADGTEVLTADAAELSRGVVLQRGPAFEQAEMLRQAIVEKNRLFFARWRPENETYLRGFRQREQGRNVVELPLFDPLIGKQETRIARLRRPVASYFHLIPAAPPSRIGPERVPDTDPAAELASFRLADGFAVGLFAAEPMVTNPISMNWDSQGRLWVATSPIYPHLKPGQQANDEIIVLEDTDGDGKADKRTVFADGLLVPTGVLPGDGGAYVANSTELVHMSDTDGDGHADQTRVLLSGFGTEDTHQILHAFRWGPGGRLFFNQSVLINSHIETPHGVRRLAAGGIWTFDVQRGWLDVYTRGMVNPWGFQFDRWGQSFATDGAYREGINYVWPGAAFYWARGVPRILKGLNPGQPKECGLEILSGRHLPSEWQSRLLTADFRAHRIVSFELSDSKSGYFSEQKEDLLESDHVAFRPVDIKMGPDGAIFVCDWYNPIINHGEVDFRDPRRDHQHGRIWRISAVDRPLLENPQIHQASVDTLLERLLVPEQWTRDMARQELKYRDRDAVIAKLDDWKATLDPTSPDFHQRQLEALWAFETLAAVPPEYLQQLLHSSDYRVRSAAVRVLGHVSGRLPQALSWLQETIADDHPRVRLESINALRAVGSLSAFEVALRALDHPMDELIDFALWVTVRELEEVWLPPFEAGQVSFGGDVRRVAFVLASSEKQSMLRPLVDKYRSGFVEGEDRARVAQLIAATGNAEQLRLLFDDLSRADPVPDRATLLSHLVDAARERRLKPVGDLRSLAGLFAEEPASVTLAGLWQLHSAASELHRLAGGTTVGESTRIRAIEALAQLGDDESWETLSRIASSETSGAIRARAIAGMAVVDVDSAARVAATALGELESVDAATIFEGFLAQSTGPKMLAKRLEGHSLPAEIAALGRNMASPLGQRTSELVDVLRVASGAVSTRADLTSDQWSALLAEVNQADAARGESIYRRTKLQCQKCHAIGGVGGKVGPDLMSLGASAPLDYVAESLVHPSRKIKEGYETTVVILDSGQILTGMVIGEIGESLVLRNPENVIQKVPKQQVDEKITQPVSLMPTGLTDGLSRQEFVDLLAFLAQLGKGAEFRVPTRGTVRSWQVLQTKTPLRSDTFLREPGDWGWVPALSRANGVLPLDDFASCDVDDRRSQVVRFCFDVDHAGLVSLRFRTDNPFQIWMDGEPIVPKGNELCFEATPGPHWITLALGAEAGAGNTLIVERLDPPASPARFGFRLEY